MGLRMRKITDNLNHDPQLVRLRKAESELEICGMGVVLFGIWNVLQTCITLIVNREMIYETIAETGGTNSRGFRWAVYITVGVLMAIIIWIRCWIGMSASREAEARARKVKSTYLILTALLATVSIFSLVAYVYQIVQGIEVMISLAAILFELVSMLTSIHLILAALAVRRIRRVGVCA